MLASATHMVVFNPALHQGNMRRTEAADAALKLMANGQTAYICYDGDLRVDPTHKFGTVILVGKPEKMVTRETLLVLLSHRMRIRGVC